MLVGGELGSGRLAARSSLTPTCCKTVWKQRFERGGFGAELVVREAVWGFDVGGSELAKFVLAPALALLSISRFSRARVAVGGEFRVLQRGGEGAKLNQNEQR